MSGRASGSRSTRAPSARSAAVRERQKRAAEDKVDDRAQGTRKGNKYKEKFYELRTKYDAVTATNAGHTKDLATSQAKLRKLQDECDVLLDTISVSVTSQPSLMQFLEGSPAPEGPPEGGPADQYQHHGMEIDEGGPPNGHGHPGAHMVLMQPPPGHQGFVGDPRDQQFQGQTQSPHHHLMGGIPVDPALAD